VKFDLKLTYHGDLNKAQYVKEALDGVAKYAVELIRDKARAFVPVDTGTLKESIETKKIPNGYSVGPNTDYDVYVEFGTGMHSTIGPAHYIYPKKAKFLSWVNRAGERIFARRTRGAAAQPYLRPAMDESRKPIGDFLAARVRVALAKGTKKA